MKGMEKVWLIAALCSLAVYIFTRYTDAGIGFFAALILWRTEK